MFGIREKRKCKGIHKSFLKISSSIYTDCLLITLRTPRNRETQRFKNIIFKRFLYSLIGSGIVQLNIFISMLFASLVGEGAISQIYYADRIIDLPFALIAVAMSFTLLPYLSKNISDESKNSRAFNETVIFCFLFAIPSAFGIFILSEEIIRVLFGRG